ncbi:MAG: histidine kinase [Bacteroidales bacterium]|nr:histidine kinase [Bacteroidales bacterium]
MTRKKPIFICLMSFLLFYPNVFSNTDTSLIRSYIIKSEGYFSKNSDSALFYSSKAVKACSFISDQHLISEVYKTHGIVFYYKTRYDSSAYYMNIAIKHVPKDDEIYLATLYNIHASVLIMDNKYDTALYYIENAYNINKRLNNKQELVKNLANFGLVYKCMGAFDLSIKYIYQGLPVAEELKDTAVLIKLLHSISANFLSMKKPGQAVNYGKQALGYSLAMKNYKRASEISNSIANAHEQLEQYDEAKRNYQLSYDYAHKINYATMEAAALVNLGLFYAHKLQFDSALFYLAKGKSIAQKYNFAATITAADITYSKIYTETKEYDKALKHLLAAIEGEDKAESSIINAAYLQLSEVYAAIGDYPKAYKYHVIYTQRNDSAINKQKLEEIAGIRTQYELNKKQELMDAELEASASKLKLIRTISIVGFIVIMIIAALLVITFRFKQKQKVTNLKNEIDNYRQRLMAQQMNPHFIFNTLNSVQYFIYNNKKEESMEYISQFAQLMRLNLYNSQNDIIALKDEIEALKLYLELERIRLDNKFDYTIEVGPEIDVSEQLVPSFLIQPLVENSIKHGFLKIEHKGNIHTSIIRRNGSLVYNIIDNGAGIKRTTASHEGSTHKSYGLELTKKRIALIGILNNKQTSFTFTENTGPDGNCSGTRAELVIPSSLRLI